MKTISTNECARRLNCSISNVNYLLRKGAIAGVKGRKKWAVDADSFERHIAEYNHMSDCRSEIRELEHELHERKEFLQMQIKHTKFNGWFLNEAIRALQTIFCETNTQFDIGDVLYYGPEHVAKGIGKRYATITKSMRRLVKHLQNMPKYLDVIQENNALAQKLQLAETALARCAKKLQPHENVQIECVKLVDCDLPIGTLNRLASADLKTIGDLCDCKKSRLLKIRNFGIKKADEIEEFLSKYGLALKAEQKY